MIGNGRKVKCWWSSKICTFIKIDKELGSNLYRNIYTFQVNFLLFKWCNLSLISNLLINILYLNAKFFIFIFHFYSYLWSEIVETSKSGLHSKRSSIFFWIEMGKAGPGWFFEQGRKIITVISKKNKISRNSLSKFQRITFS